MSFEILVYTCHQLQRRRPCLVWFSIAVITNITKSTMRKTGGTRLTHLAQGESLREESLKKKQNRNLGARKESGIHGRTLPSGLLSRSYLATFLRSAWLQVQPNRAHVNHYHRISLHTVYSPLCCVLFLNFGFPSQITISFAILMKKM